VARRIRVAIIGGGCAGVAAAFELTRPERENRFEVTVYQLGWRLGGKGASGRGPAQRIEEHGLHLWMGFYENAFRLIRQCYTELDRDPEKVRIASWDQAFRPDNHCGMMDFTSQGEWLPWTTTFPALDGMPGDTGAARRWSIGDYLAKTVGLLAATFRGAALRSGARIDASERPTSQSAEHILGAMLRVLRFGPIVSLNAILEGLSILDLAVGYLPQLPAKIILDFHAVLTKAMNGALESLVARDEEMRRLWEVSELALAAVRGIISFGLVTHPHGFDAINDYDCRAWLQINGASERAINSAFIRALYDLAFAYEDGDVNRPKMAAGEALRGAFRSFFTYRGAFFWKMTSGMGDVVFAPFYEVLQKRGVRFEFFHRLTNLSMHYPKGLERPHVQALEFDVQARTLKNRAYYPLTPVGNLPCWPAEPLWDQLEDGAALRSDKVDFESAWDSRRASVKTLSVGQDFDQVVLAIGLGAVPEVSRELVESDPRFRSMVANVKTVPTQAVQVWLRESVEQLGWDRGPVNVSGFVEPFDTWADMQQLIVEERFAAKVQGIAYFCSVLPDGTAKAMLDQAYPELRREEVRRNGVRFLGEAVSQLWPLATDVSGRFRWELLVAPHERADQRPTKADESAFVTQYWRANVNPTERYTLTLPGTVTCRISPLDQTYANLTLAGDWTNTGFNHGCVESAVMSGMLAAHAISGSPSLEAITGYDHP
jgi:uncharacterized protein with NAD-binding domain and iron-sulfur cluster